MIAVDGLLGGIRSEIWWDVTLSDPTRSPFVKALKINQNDGHEKVIPVKISIIAREV